MNKKLSNTQGYVKNIFHPNYPYNEKYVFMIVLHTNKLANTHDLEEFTYIFNFAENWYKHVTIFHTEQLIQLCFKDWNYSIEKNILFTQNRFEFLKYMWSINTYM